MKKIKLQAGAILTLLFAITFTSAIFAEEKPLQAQLPKNEFAATANTNASSNSTSPVPSTEKVETAQAAQTEQATPPTPVPTPMPTPIPTPTPIEIKIFPVDVQERVDENGNRQIIKVYEVSTDESPNDILKEPFERDGWRYTLSDIVKADKAAVDVKEQIETVKKETSTDDINSIIKQLAPTMEYQSDDGYAGVLTLDVSSIKCETAGYKNTSYKISGTREFNNLSYNDTSLIPKTINENGSTLSLADISWKAQNTDAIDYNSITASYTAIAKYTATASKKTVTGYVTSAVYKGNVSRIVKGKTLYTAYFDGVEIVKPTPTPEPEPEPTAEPITEPEPPKNTSPIPVVATTVSTTGLIAGFVFFFFVRRNVKVFNLKEGKYSPIGKTRVGMKNPIIDLTKFTEKAATGSFILVLDKLASKQLNGQTVAVNYGEKSFQHIIEGDGNEYQFEVDF